MVVEIGEFKGAAIIKLKRDTDDMYPFSFGVGKAKLILSNLDAIKKFVEENDKPKEEKIE
jgi:hypothetical protein